MRNTLFLAFSFATLLVNAQDQIIKKNGTSFDAKITEVGQWKISYKKFDNPDGPIYVVDKAEIYKIIFNDKTEETLGKYPTADVAKDFIISKINEFGIDRDNNSERLSAQFIGDNLKINSVNKKGKVTDDGDEWDLHNVIKFHDLSPRKDVYYLNIVTKRFKKSATEVDKLVIKFTDFQAADDVLFGMKDLQFILKKD